MNQTNLAPVAGEAAVTAIVALLNGGTAIAYSGTQPASTQAALSGNGWTDRVSMADHASKHRFNGDQCHAWPGIGIAGRHAVADCFRAGGDRAGVHLAVFDRP
ncbi:MAG: hypothetical protein PHT60_16280 [Acidiphilium sp.]|nr:hypothetical protein [Gallionella sp.]MDD4937322.1 hypothetical protein [Acidiphilium sp.]